MPLASRNLALILALTLCATGGGLLRAADRYEAWLSDGKKVTSNFLAAWPTPGSAYRFENQELLEGKNPVRLIRDRAMAASLRAPYVVLANGDILSASPVALEPTLGRLTAVPRIKLQLEPPLMPVVGTGLAVRTDRIVRMVLSADAQRTEPPPGTVVLADGRRLAARSLRWRESGLAILTAEGIVEAAYGELADVVFPNVDKTSAVLDDNLWAGPSQLSAAQSGGLTIARFQMAGGAVITTSRVRREIEQSRRRRLTTTVSYYVQPSWADQPLSLPETQIVACGYRRADEVPLSLLTAKTLVNERLIGQAQPWLANRTAAGDLLSAGGRESDLGILAHAKSAIAFDLPAAARTLQTGVAMDKSVGRGGCVQCTVLAGDKALAGGEEGSVLWDAGIFTGRDGCLESPEIDVAGQTRVILVAEYAHDGRPEGADPLDIRDQFVWLAPTVTIDSGRSNLRRSAASTLSGIDDWQLVGGGWDSLTQGSRWNLLSRNWETLVLLPRQKQLQLRRSLNVSRANDVLELLVSCPANRDEHDFSLTVNGTEVDPTNNADRDELRQWVARTGRLPFRDDIEDPRASDLLAYWWDLSRWRGQEVNLELTLRGTLERSEIAWRGLSLRSAIGNLPASGRPLQPQVALTSLTAEGGGGRRPPPGSPLPNAIPVTGSRMGEPIRFLGQSFIGGYGMGRNSSISFPLKSEYRKFVAVAGCCLQVVGPMQVLIDDQVVWERTVVSSLTPAEQIEIDIPAGAAKLTLQNGRTENSWYGYAAWADAGFVTK